MTAVKKRVLIACATQVTIETYFIRNEIRGTFLA
jgi:hypothetical protein